MADHRDKRREDQRSAYKSVRHRTGRVQRQRRATKSVHKDKREENREYCSGQCSCDHWAQTGIKHQPHELTRVGAESRANSELASPPGHRIPHCSIDSEQRQQTCYASYKQQHLADYPSLLGVIIHMRTQSAGKHQHLEIEVARNMFHRCRNGIGGTAEAYENELAESRTGAQHIHERAIVLEGVWGGGIPQGGTRKTVLQTSVERFRVSRFIAFRAKLQRNGEHVSGFKTRLRAEDGDHGPGKHY